MNTLGLRTALVGLSLVGLSAGCSGGTDDDDDGGTPLPTAVDITTGTAPPPRFIPQSTVMAAGGTVTFTNAPNEHNVSHNVSSATNAWPITTLAAGEQFSVTLSDPGNYVYECTIHAGMTGLISVQ